MGEEVVGGLRFVCSDMWKAYLKVIAAKAGQALHVLAHFHITMHLNQAVDEVRRAETGRLRGQAAAQKLKHMRWKLLRRGRRVRGLGQTEIARTLGVQPGDGSGLDAQGDLPALLALPLAQLGQNLSFGVD